MQLEETFHSKDGKHKGWKLASMTPRRQSLAMKGYIFIFKFREYLLNESINYRYYYEDNEGQSHVTEFTEKDIAQYMKFSNAGIQVNESALKLRGVKQEWDAIINKYFQTYTGLDYMKQSNAGYGYVVRSTIMARYQDDNEGLKTKAGKYQTFNRGHIYEAIDSSLSHILYKDQATSIEAEAMQNYVFGKYLTLDSIKASRRGDNIITNTSVKSGSADLYDFYTIKEQLTIILGLIQSANKSQSELVDDIIKLFLHRSAFDNSEEKMIAAADKAYKKLIDLLKVDKKT